jgi:dCTP deaminase
MRGRRLLGHRPRLAWPIPSARRGLLVDRDIRAAVHAGELVIDDPDWPSMLRPAAISLRLGEQGYVLSSQQAVDVADADTYPLLQARDLDAQGRLLLRPREVLLVRTQERIGVSDRLVGLLDGTSDYARLGISVVLAHQVSPGYGMPDGSPLTLEIVSRLGHDVFLRPGARIANLMLLRGRWAERSYRDMPANHSSASWSVRSRLSEVIKAR